MNRQIAKTAIDEKNYRREIRSYNSARQGFREVLKACNLQPGEQVLLPAYIGWSSREGSGVFDPVRELNLPYCFYRINRDLIIDMADLTAKLSESVKVLVLIHYFGRPDSCLEEIVDIARHKNIRIIEDAAHAWYSSWVGGTCGYLGDATVYSLHKMLPLPAGGLLQLNANSLVQSLGMQIIYKEYLEAPARYNIWQIAQRRLENYRVLQKMLIPLAGKIDRLWPDDELPAGIYPQSFPVLIRCKPRDDFYFTLNAAGFGAVSLYHELIQEISPAEFPDAHWLAQHILNLPVHQDCTLQGLKEMVRLITDLAG